MRANPFLYALYAAAYIGIVALVIHGVSAVSSNTPDTLLDPMAALSLLVFSAALMAFLFFYQPVVLLLDNKKKEAVSFFLKTLVAFGILTAIVLISVSIVAIGRF